MVVAQAIVLFFGLLLSLAFFRIAIKLLLADKSEYEMNRKLSGNWKNPFIGGVPTCHDGQRDYRVRAGLARDTKTNRWVEQGILSDEAVDAVLRPKSS